MAEKALWPTYAVTKLEKILAFLVFEYLGSCLLSQFALPVSVKTLVSVFACPCFPVSAKLGFVSAV
jgi:hypothetical protein